MNFELISILITVILQALYVAFKIGKFEEKLSTIEKKQDKHNNLIERTYHLEDSLKSAHLRINELKENIK